MRGAFIVVVASALGCYSGSDLPSSEEASATDTPGTTSGPSDEPEAPEPDEPDPDEGSTGSAQGSEGSSSSSTGAGTDAGSSSTGIAEGDTSTGEMLTGCDALPDAWLCDNFDASIDPATWTTRTGGGASIDVDNGELTINIGSVAAAHAFIGVVPAGLFPLPDNHMFGRVMLHVSPQAPDRHNYLISASGPLGGSVARYRLDSNNGTLNSRYTHASVEQHGGWRKLGIETPSESWTCLEWEFDGSTNSMRFWFDGVLDVDMEVDGAIEDPPWVAPPFENFELGYHTYQAAENGDSFEIRYDDLVLDGQRVGCDAGR